MTYRFTARVPHSLLWVDMLCQSGLPMMVVLSAAVSVLMVVGEMARTTKERMTGFAFAARPWYRAQIPSHKACGRQVVTVALNTHMHW